MVWLWLLSACKPEEGVPDDSGCIPLLVETNCSIWECWQSLPNGQVQYTFATGWDGHQFQGRSGSCTSPSACSEQEQAVARDYCGGAA